MKCPNCDSSLSSLEIIDDYGQNLKVDRCVSCESFWFNKNNLYQVPIQTGQKIDSPASRPGYSSSMRCPNDQTVLMEFKDSNLPSSIVMFRCSSCRGIFLPKGQLYAYKEYQKQRAMRGIELSRKASVGFSIAFLIFVFGLIATYSSEYFVKADPIIYQAYKPIFDHSKGVFWILAAVLFLLFMLCITVFYFRKNKIKFTIY
ncbi:MAG: zf-TFIIB domain-containing protein [Candidatus Berkelbacteria bacterium]|nr:zf-TFIIB domain-containing protein [Candidatus Berkelbacteria bacterium]